VSWSIVELKDVCSLLTDGTHYTPPDVGTGIPFLTVKDVSETGLDFQSCSRITLEEYQKANAGNSAPKAGDVLFSKDGTVGKVHVVKEMEPFAVLSSLAILRPKENVDSDYLGYALKSPQTLRQAAQNKTGSALRRIILSDIKTLEIPLPPLREQKRIAAILDKADAIRRKRQQAIQLADDFLRAVFLDMFGDPVTNPKEWPMSTFGEVFDVRDGTHDSPKYIDSGYPLVTSKNIKNGMLDLTDVNYISQDDYDSINKRSKVDIRDVLMPMIGTIGNPVIVNFEPNFAIKNVALIKTKNAKVPPEIVKMLLDGPLLNHAISSLGRGGTQKFLSLGDIRQLSCYLPDPRAIEKYLMINTKIQSLLKKYFEHENSEIFESISQKVFAGEL
jgi:type I restriction enzyme S subunit